MVLGRFENNIHKYPSSTIKNINTVESLSVNYWVLAEKCNEKNLSIALIPSQSDDLMIIDVAFKLEDSSK
jgi:hypothetical protein